jgi:hypothetical protein
MSFPVFVSGDVLNASDMNAVGLWKVYSASFAGVTSIILPNGTFTSDYRNYRITYNIAVNADSDFTVRLRKNGADDTNSTYNTQLSGVASTGAASDSAVNSGSSWAFGEQDSGLDFYAVTFDLYQPQLNTRTSASGNVIFANKPASASIGRAGGWYHFTPNQFDSLSFISNQANSMTGVVQVYGYRD